MIWTDQIYLWDGILMKIPCNAFDEGLVFIQNIPQDCFKSDTITAHFAWRFHFPIEYVQETTYYQVLDKEWTFFVLRQ